MSSKNKADAFQLSDYPVNRNFTQQNVLLFPRDEAFHLPGDAARSHPRVTNGPKQA